MSKKIQVIVGSTRQNRLGGQIAEWVTTVASNNTDIEVEVVDLLEENLPTFNAAVSPMYAADTSPAGQAWGEKIGSADGYIFVTPEYNRSIPASLKNAIDFLYAQWGGKSAAIVSYGWIDGGASASAHLSDILSWVKLSVSESKTALKLAPEIMGEDGKVSDIDVTFESYAATLEAAVAELAAHEPAAEPVTA